MVPQEAVDWNRHRRCRYQRFFLTAIGLDLSPWLWFSLLRGCCWWKRRVYSREATSPCRWVRTLSQENYILPSHGTLTTSGWNGPGLRRKWTMRILGLILLVVQGVANMVSNILTFDFPCANHPGGLTNPRAFKSVPYSLYVLAAFVGFLGMYTPLTFIDVSAIRTAHLSRDFSFDLVSIINAASLIGRVGGGLCSDRFGVINILAGFSCVGALSTFVWPTVKSKGGLVALSIAYGAGSGPLVGLLAAPVAHLGDTVDVGRRTVGWIGTRAKQPSLTSRESAPGNDVYYRLHWVVDRPSHIWCNLRCERWIHGGWDLRWYVYSFFTPPVGGPSLHFRLCSPGCTIVVYVVILMLVKKSAIGTWRGKF